MRFVISPRYRHISLFAALTGAGAQLCVVMVSLLLCALLGVFRATRRGSILTSIPVLYSMTAWVAGLMSARCDVRWFDIHHIH